MDRRSWGAVIIAISLLLAVALPAALGRGIGGQAVRQPTPPHPIVGDCLLSAVNTDGSALKYALMAIGTARIGTCSARSTAGNGSFGEVVSITVDHNSFPRSFPNQVPTPEPRTCRPAAQDYIGWPDGSWVSAITGTLILLGPDISQYMSGQRWIACVILPVKGGYAGSIRAHPAGPAADAFARCEIQEVSGKQPVACTDVHNIEIFGSAAVDKKDDSTVEGSCRELVTAVTGMADPTAGGQLQIITRESRFSRDISTASTTFAATCGVRVNGHQLLSASLLGLGGGPLPWS